MSRTGEILIRPRGPLEGTVRVPSSKSLTNRALALAALASGRSTIAEPLLAGDTVCMVRGLRALGVGIEDVTSGLLSPRALTIEGCGGDFRAPAQPLDLAGAGTAMRFLTALASLARGDVVLDGNARMRRRPMGPLLQALSDLGVETRSLRVHGSPPVLVRGGTLAGGTVRLAGDVSSQFVSALLMVAPLAQGSVVLDVLPPIVSRPYIDMTLGLMQAFGIESRGRALPGRVKGPAAGQGGGVPERFEFAGRGSYASARYRVPPDASSASYFFAAAAATGGRVRVLGVHEGESQGDTALLGYLAKMGCGVTEDESGTTVIGPQRGSLRAFALDLSATPDLVPTLAILALFADGVSEIRNVANLRLKESDRLRALAIELERLGARVDEQADGLIIAPRPLSGRRIETHRDHRIAMAFAVAGLVVPGVTVADPACVAKSFPGFWTALAELSGN